MDEKPYSLMGRPIFYLTQDQMDDMPPPKFASWNPTDGPLSFLCSVNSGDGEPRTVAAEAIERMVRIGRPEGVTYVARGRRLLPRKRFRRRAD